MKHVPSEKHTVAWFKLAECVARGEKERALGVYKLLAHSLDDAAFATQLAGDLLLAFQDDEAIDKYREAAIMYKKQQRFVEAAAVYEHLITLQPAVDDYVVSVVVLYQILNFSDKIAEHLKRSVDRFSTSDNAKKLNAFLAKLEELSPENYHQACQFVAGKK